MIYNFLRKIKNILIKNIIFSNLLAKMYVLYNKFYLKNNVDIYKSSKNWIHKTSIGLIPSDKPIFNPEVYVKQNFDIFFEKYFPKKNDIVVEFGSGIGCETLYISKIIEDNGKVIAIEPYNQVYYYLKETIKLNNLKNVTAINKALFKNSSGIGFTSDLNHWLGGKINVESENKVSSVCLNELVKKEDLKKINFCKINIEGAEKFITENSDNFFDICENISIECHDFLDGEEYKTFELVKNFLISKNYIIKLSKRNKYPWDKYFIYGSK